MKIKISNIFSESLDLSCSHFLAWKLFSESILAIKGNNGVNAPLVGKQQMAFYNFAILHFFQESNVKVTLHFSPRPVVKLIQSFL